MSQRLVVVVNLLNIGHLNDPSILLGSPRHLFHKRVGRRRLVHLDSPGPVVNPHYVNGTRYVYTLRARRG